MCAQKSQAPAKSPLPVERKIPWARHWGCKDLGCSVAGPSPNSSTNQPTWATVVRSGLLHPQARIATSGNSAVVCEVQAAASPAPGVSRNGLQSQVAMVWNQAPLINLILKPLTASTGNQTAAFPRPACCLHIRLARPHVQLSCSGLHS
jgi:hypothetical protein